MNDPRLIGFSVLLALLWSGAALAWLLCLAKDRARRVSTLVMVGFALAFGPIAFSKNGDPPLRSGAAAPSPPVVSLLLAEVRTNAVFGLSMPSNAVAHGPWLRRGASDDWFWFHSTNDFFRAGTNAFRSVRVSSRGTLAFPGGSRLEPFHAVLGVLPEPNWTNAPSRFWQAPTVGGGHLFTWEGAALDRDSATPGSFQAELLPDGGMVGRYDLPHPATNFVIAALGETALSVRGDVTNAATVRRANGATIPETSLAELLRDATRFELVWRAAEGDPDADPDGDGLTTRDEIGRHGTDPKQADTDGDGLSDASEILLGSNPLDADEDGDGIPDGVLPASWAASPIWGDVAGKTNLVLSLDSDVPAGGAATLLLGSHAIPLRGARSWALCIPEGPVTPFDLRTMNGAVVSLSLSEPATGAPDPIHLDDPDGVFRVEPSAPMRAVPAHSPSPGGTGHLCVFDVRFANLDTGEPAPDNECIHDATGVRRLTLQFSDSVHEGLTPTWTSPTMWDMPGWIELCVSDQPGDTDTASATFTSPQLVCGTKTLTATIHRCTGGHLVWCHACCMYHDPNEVGCCPHTDGCPAKTNATAACTCLVPAVRVSDAIHGFWHDLGFYYPKAASCCCRPSIGLAKARLAFKSGNLSIADTNRLYQVGDYLPGTAWVSATAISGSEPSRIVYDIIHFHADGNGMTSEEVVRTETNQLWAISLAFTPITTLTNAYGFVNPCAIICGHDATFELSILPQQFPESRIKWNAAPMNRTSFPMGNLGRQLTVHAGELHTSPIRLRATIDGYYGPSPECWFDVVPETSVQVHAFIVGDGTHFACQAGDIPPLLSGANRIWSQGGGQFELGSVSSITHAAWLTHISQSNYWPSVDQMCNYTNGTGGLEVYIVDDLFIDSTRHANGLATPGGLVIRSAASSDTLAHEFGHAMGLKDIYSASRDDGSSPVTGVATKDRMPYDWGTDATEAYYPEGMLQTEILPLIIMNGEGVSGKCVLPYGRIQGVWYPDGYNAPLSTNIAPVGMTSISTRNPSSQ